MANKNLLGQEDDDSVVKLSTIFSSATDSCISNGEDSGLTRKSIVTHDDEVYFSPRQIRKVMEMYMKGIRVEVILKKASRGRYTTAMRGMFHCNKCFERWTQSSERINCYGDVKNSIVFGETMVFGKEESLHIIKIALGCCYTGDENIVKILNEINENGDGTFFIAAGHSGNRYRSDYSPVLYSTQCGRKIPGTFIFSLRRTARDDRSLFSPYFHIPITVRGVKPSKRIISIFDDDKKGSSSKIKRKSAFCTVAGKIFDASKIFTSGLLGCFPNWEVFLSGEMNHDCFIPTACIMDSGIALFWPRDNKKSQNVTFQNIEEILQLTKRSFPCFPEDKVADRKGLWTLIKDRRFSELPPHFYYNRDRHEEKAHLGVLYLGGLEMSMLKSERYFKIEYQAFHEPGEVVSRASSESKNSFVGRNEKAVKPSGLPMETDEGNIISGVSQNTLEREPGSRDCYNRRPSVAWFREINSNEEMDLVQKKSSSLMQRNPPEAINPAVKNRTGKPSTRPGQLSDGASPINLGGETRQITPKPMKMIPRPQSKQSSMSDFKSLTGIAQEFEKSRKKSILMGEAKDATPQAPNRTNRNEFDRPTTKERSTLPSSQSQDSSRIVTMRQRTGDLQAGNTKKRRTRKESRTDTMQEILNEKRSETAKPEEMPIIQAEFSTHDVSAELDDFALPSEHFLPKVAEKKLKKKSLLSFLNNHSILNFTENFRFSYFMVPGYVKQKNEKIKNGLLKLPSIKQELEPHKRRSKDRSDLMKRIERLNKFHGNTAARVRQ